MQRWVPYPFVRMVVFFIAGILWAIFKSPVEKDTALIITASLAALYLLFRQVFVKRLFLRYNLLCALTGFACIACLGYLTVKLHDDTTYEHHIVHQDTFDAYQAVVRSPAVSTEKTNKYLAEVIAIHQEHWQPATGKVYLYVENAHSTVYQYGDRLMINGHPKLLPPPQNPGVFDYKQFLAFKNIHHQQYVKEGHINPISCQYDPGITGYIYKIRQWASEITGTYVLPEREAHIAQALTLGIKEGLTEEIKNAYAATGAMHILAVSGLHVGIIYGLILLIFGRLPFRGKSGRWLTAAISLCCLWLYAALTGFSPSVFRAVVMFSGIAIAKATDREVNIYNTLAASAFIMLLFDPFLIMSVGFQLSYIAVLGIVYIQPKVYGAIITKHYVLDKLWLITSVSVAAQLATSPISLFYFHQFPNYFLLSNPIAIPGAFLILTGGISLFAFSGIEPVAALIGNLLGQLIFIMNEAILWIERLPYSMTTGIYISPVQCWLLAGAVFLFFLFFQFKKMYYLLLFTVSLGLFSALRWDRLLANERTGKLTIYKINRHTAIEVIRNGTSVLSADPLLLRDTSKIGYNIEPNRLLSGVRNRRSVPLEQKQETVICLDVGDKNMIVLDKPLDRFELTDKLKTDYLVIAKGYKGNFNRLFDFFDADLVILDGSLSYFYAHQLKSWFDKHSIDYYSVYHSGSFVTTI